MNTLKVATFNVENLFARFQFRRNISDLSKINKDGWTVNQTLFSIHNERSKKITAEAIKALDADVVAVQEVENLDALKKFRTDFLGGRKSYPYLVVLDGNDPRRIDVGVLSRYPLKNVNTYSHLWSSELKYYTFSRDCLEVEVHAPDNFVLTLYVNHFKSMMGGRVKTSYKRKVQSSEVMKIVKSRFGENPGEHPFIILGDFNDYIDQNDAPESGISNLVNWDQVENVLNRLPEEERWTHYYKSGNSYSQLDYVLVSKSLAVKNPNLPYIERRGIPKRAAKYDGERFPNVGQNSPKASDHCPVVFEMNY